MPIIAVAAAAASWAFGGGAALSAVFAGTASLATTLTAVAAVGATVGAIGAVTGNKDLQLAGTIVGGIGGIGSLAANAGLLGESATTESLFGQSTESMMGGDAAASLTSEEAAQTSSLADVGIPLDEGSALVGAAGSGSGAGTDIINSLGQINTDAINPAEGLAGNVAPAVVNAGASGAAPAAATAPTGAAATTTGILNTPTAAPGAAAGAGSASASPNSAGLFGTLFGKNSSMSPLAQYGLIQSAGSFIGGAFDTLKPAQVNALNAQAEANRAAASITQQQSENMKGNLPVATRAVQPQVTGTTTGLINAPSNAQVTGQVMA